MPVYLMGSNALHLQLIQGTLQAAGWRSDEIEQVADAAALEAALLRQPQASLVLDLGEGQDSSPLDWLGELARQHSGLQVLLLSARRHEALLLQAMRCGVREVLDSPPEPAELVRTLQRLAPQGGPTPAPAATLAPMLAFISSKGGNGSTQLASNLAWLLATEFDRDTVLADLDLAFGDASFYLGGGQAQHSIDQLLRQGERLDWQLLRSSLHPVHPRLQLLASPALPSLTRAMGPQALARVLTLARQHQQVVVLDLPRQLDALTLQALQLADTVFIVLRHRVPDVRNAQRLIRVLQDNGVGPQHLQGLLNREGESARLDAQAIARAMPCPIAYRVANDPSALQGCVHLGLPLHAHAPGSPVLRDLRQLASQALQLPMPDKPGWLGRWLGKSAHPTPA